MEIYNPVHYIPKEEYDRELEKYIEHVRDVPGLEAVYTLGSPNVPGLSDLDVVCIVKDNINPSDAAQLNINYKKFNPQIFLHGPLVFPESLSKQISFLLYTINFARLWTRTSSETAPIVLSEPPESVLLAHALDQAEQKLDLYHYDLKRGATDKRRRLRALSFFLHAEAVFKLIDLKAGPLLTKGAKELRSLRDNWKRGEICGDEEFLSLYRQSDEAAREVFLTALGFFYRKIGSPPITKKNVNYLVAAKRVNCSETTSAPHADRRYVRLFSYSRLYMATQAPIQYAAYLECYNGFGKRACAPTANDFLKHFLTRRKNILAHNRFLDDKKINFSPRSYTGLPTRFANRWDVRLFDRAYWFFELAFVHFK